MCGYQINTFFKLRKSSDTYSSCMGQKFSVDNLPRIGFGKKTRCAKLGVSCQFLVEFRGGQFISVVRVPVRYINLITHTTAVMKRQTGINRPSTTKKEPIHTERNRKRSMSQRKSSKRKFQTSKKIFTFVFARCEWALKNEKAHGTVSMN